MLNRRHLRVKVLQSLYAYYQSNNEDLAVGEKELLFGIDKIRDLFLYQLSLLNELLTEEERIIEENLSKHLPTNEDLHPKRRFLDNKCLLLIAGNKDFLKASREKGIGWQIEKELIRKLMLTIRDQNYYKTYVSAEETDLRDDTRFVIAMLNKSILPFEPLHSFYEEKSIYWLDDWELVNKTIIKMLKLCAESGGELVIPGLYKDISDRQFAIELFKRTIVNQADFDKIISAKTKNWDMERIALMDVIIMQMAISEILKFPEIPVKVSLNEYIELSKMYSTPRSNIFVNGVLDKLVDDFTEQKLISRYDGR
jgi:transcription antitermination protein NusB